MVMDQSEDEELLSPEDPGEGEWNATTPLTDRECANSSYAHALREKISVVRKESAADVMNLLASSGQPSACQRRPLDAAAALGLESGSNSNNRLDQANSSKDEQNSRCKAVAVGEDGESTAEMRTCIECEDQHAELVCLACDEAFCRPCWGSLHRQGKRAEHLTQAIIGEVMAAPTASPESLPPEAVVGMSLSERDSSEADVPKIKQGVAVDVGGDTIGDDGSGRSEKGDQLNGKRGAQGPCPLGLAVGRQGISILDECRFIPLRLDERERGLLAMLKGALNVSEYTDRVDVISSRRGSKARTIDSELRYALAALSGMMMAGDWHWGQKNGTLLDTLEENQDAFAEIFEVGRRYKITNPDKFRSFYGKMMFMLQDAQGQGRSDLNLIKKIKMVYEFVEEKDGLETLMDERVGAATADVSGIAMSKLQVREQVAAKKEARTGLLHDHVSHTFSRDDMERVLDSIADANNYIAFNVAPVERIITLLETNFHPDKPDEEWSLKLSRGRRKRLSSASLYNSGYGSFSSGYGGYGMSSMFGSSTAMLSHDHRTQYTFVMQSLRLWSKAMRNMYRLWFFADSDLLSGKATYRLCNTGQGLNRVQSCPSVSVEMRRVLRIVQSECGPWVGLSVVHLGDRDVPNALVFIDKYTQIPRILNPIAEAVQSLEKLALDPVIGNYVDIGWGGVQNAKMAILSDFFKGGFDGSGDDGGSCIDGRLTSAWNWCSLLTKKPFAPMFHLAGQYGFDGGWSSGLAD